MSNSNQFLRLLCTGALGASILIGVSGCETNPALRRSGRDALEAGDVSRADRQFGKAVQQDPTDWKAQYYLGLVRLKQDRPGEAQLALERALALRHNYEETPAILDALAEALYRQDRAQELQAMLKQATDTYGYPEDYLRQAQYLARIGDVDGARLAFRKTAHFWSKGDPAPYLLMADFYESIGDRGSALRALRQAYGITPLNQKIADRIRGYGMVPGPTVALPPDELTPAEQAQVGGGQRREAP